MAYLRVCETSDIIYLREYHTIGRRSTEIDTFLDYPVVSKLHAVIEWKKPNWVIRDMSSNGTWINDDRLPPYTTHILKQGDTLQIAGIAELTFDVVAVDPPIDMIYNAGDEPEILALSENHLLPNHDQPLIELYKCPERHQWFAQHIHSTGDQALELGPYEHNSQLQVGDVTWTFFIVKDSDETTLLETNKKDIGEVEFRFDLSQDEENANLTLIQGSQELDLCERSHHYLLVHLLRHRQTQIASGKSPEIPGWISCQLLTKDLGIDETHMNILVYRARQQITSALVGFSGSSKLFERRRGAIRTGIQNFSIYKEGRKEL